jgi:putative ABC transport system permease protein
VNSINRFVFTNLAHRPVSPLSIRAIAVEVAIIPTLIGVSFGTLDGTARRARGVGADIMIRSPGASVISLSSAPICDKLVPLLEKQRSVPEQSQKIRGS